MVNKERKCSGSQFNFSISVGSSLFDAVNREDVENLPGAVVVQCLGAGQLTRAAAGTRDREQHKWRCASHRKIPLYGNKF